jgi:hypothetical protein
MMIIKILITENEILSTPNDSELGELVRKKYWYDRINQDGNVQNIRNEPQIIDYGSNNNYIYPKSNQYDKCVICGQETPYTISTHIDMRFFYVEGVGQLCSKCGN